MNKAVGLRAEEVVKRYLEDQGFLIEARNVNFAFGELDIVAKDGETLVFIEVKFRKNTQFGLPYHAVTIAKQKKIIRAAQAYLQKYEVEPVCRFDVISLCGDLTRPLLEHIRDAFWVEEN